MGNLGVFYKRQGRTEEAGPLQVEALETRRRVLGEDHPGTLMSMSLVAGLYWQQQRHAESVAMYAKTLEGRTKVLGEEHPSTLTTMWVLASSYSSDRVKNYAAAESLYVKLLAVRRRVQGDDDLKTIRAMKDLGNLYLTRGRAEPLLAQAVQSARRALPPGDWNVGVALRDHGRCLTSLGRYAEAEAALLEAHATLSDGRGAEDSGTVEAANGLVELYEAWEKQGKAVQWRSKLRHD
jgi:hypothetical protein